MNNSPPPTLLFWSQKCIIWNTTERTIASCPISKLKTAHSVCEEENASPRKDSFGMQQSNEYIHQTSLLRVMAPWNRSAWKKGGYFLGLLNIVSEDPNCYPNPALRVKINSGEETNTESVPVWFRVPPTAFSQFLSVYTSSSLTSIGIDILGNWQDSHVGGLTVVTEAITFRKVELKAFYQNKNK